MGLPGSGKTTLAKQLNLRLHSKWYNADDVRKNENDWDFSPEGRIRQANRMKSLANDSEHYGFKYVICDFVAPTEQIRKLFGADLSIWMNTITKSQYNDTNIIFEKPNYVEMEVTDFNYNIDDILKRITR